MSNRHDPDRLAIDFAAFGGKRLATTEAHGFLAGPFDTGDVWDFGWEAGLAPVETPNMLAQIEKGQGLPVRFEDLYLSDGTDPDDDIFLWEEEERVFGKAIPAWNQKDVGSCVSFGWGRAAYDIIVYLMARGLIDYFPEEVATEPIYAGSRVEVGGGRLGNSDGSLGSWAAEWVKTKGGILLRKVYGAHDLRQYDTSRARQWGARGVPDDLEPEARLHPIAAVSLVTSAKDAWTGIGLRKPLPICSNYGFDSPLKAGFCRRNGTWNHCMTVRGRFRAKNGQRAYPIGNSWADYLKSLGNPESVVETYSGRQVQLPTGTFCVYEEDLDGILRQRDSYLLWDQRGYTERNRLLW
jgi:hypothetical protein